MCDMDVYVKEFRKLIETLTVNHNINSIAFEIKPSMGCTLRVSLFRYNVLDIEVMCREGKVDDVDEAVKMFRDVVKLFTEYDIEHVKFVIRISWDKLYPGAIIDCNIENLDAGKYRAGVLKI